MNKAFVTVSQAAVTQAEQAIKGCYRCSEQAQVPFSHVLDSFRGYCGEVEYFLPVLAQCPKCLREVDEKTIVSLRARRPASRAR